jgi:hypothetical protein
VSLCCCIGGRDADPTPLHYVQHALDSLTKTKYRYRRRLPHLQEADGDFFTSSLLHEVLHGSAAAAGSRNSRFDSWVLGHLDTAGREHEKRIRLYAMVAMPDRPITFTVHLPLVHSRRNPEIRKAGTEGRWSGWSSGRAVKSGQLKRKRPIMFP